MGAPVAGHIGRQQRCRWNVAPHTFKPHAPASFVVQVRPHRAAIVIVAAATATTGTLPFLVLAVHFMMAIRRARVARDPDAGDGDNGAGNDKQKVSVHQNRHETAAPAQAAVQMMPPHQVRPAAVPKTSLHAHHRKAAENRSAHVT